MQPTDEAPRLPLFFVALLPQGEPKARIHAIKLQNAGRFACRVAMKTPPHITIIPPFRLASDRVNEMIAAVKNHFAPTDNLVVKFGGVSAFEERTIYLDILLNEALKSYDLAAKNLVNAQPELFPAVRFHDVFHPHVTLANRDIAPSDFQEMKSYLESKFYPTESENLKLEVLHLDRGRWEVIS